MNLDTLAYRRALEQVGDGRNFLELSHQEQQEVIQRAVLILEQWQLLDYQTEC